MCPECGNYRDREVVDVVGAKAARMVRREERVKALTGHDTTEEESTEEEPKEEKKEVKAKKETKKVTKEKKEK